LLYYYEKNGMIVKAKNDGNDAIQTAATQQPRNSLPVLAGQCVILIVPK